MPFLLILISCKQKENPPVDQSDFWTCHHESTWDSLTTQNTLIGEWNWESVTCPRMIEGGSTEDYTGLSVEFKSDQTLDLKQEGVITQTSSWHLVEGQEGLFTLTIEPPVYQLNGRILFCKQQVEFSNSYLDGCDLFFKRED